MVKEEPFKTITKSKVKEIFFISAACLDISKAFDCLNHDVLLSKLHATSISDITHTWFKNYLSRTQTVLFDGKMSSVLNIKSGIGQGTILGPILFIFYINDLFQEIGGARINMYANDCILYSSGNSWNRVHATLQQALNSIGTWLPANALKLNVKKSKCLIIANSNKRRKYRQKFTTKCIRSASGFC